MYEVVNSHIDNIQKTIVIEHMNTGINNDKIELVDMNEVDEDSNAIHHDALLHEEDIPHADPKSFPHELIFAPGEGSQTNEYFPGCRCGIFSLFHNFLWQILKSD